MIVAFWYILDIIEVEKVSLTVTIYFIYRICIFSALHVLHNQISCTEVNETIQGVSIGEL